LLCLLVFTSLFLSHFRAVVSVIVIVFLSSDHYFITGFYAYFYSYGLLLKLNDDDDDDLGMYWPDLHQIFKDVKYVWGLGMINLTFVTNWIQYVVTLLIEINALALSHAGD